MAAIFFYAFEKGWQAYLAALVQPDTLAAIKLTLLAAVVAIACNLIFGIAAAWLIGRFRFTGRTTLLTLIDLPLAISPVIGGVIFVLLYGTKGVLGPVLSSLDIKIIFAVPGIVLATTFVTSPYIARELIPLMEQQSSNEEQAALTMGASGWKMFFWVTLPSIKWALVYGLVLCNARAMGEFGAVSVVSGHIRGSTNTMPLLIEVLYNEYAFAAAFAVASLLTLVSLGTLLIKSMLEKRY